MIEAIHNAIQLNSNSSEARTSDSSLSKATPFTWPSALARGSVPITPSGATTSYTPATGGSPSPALQAPSGDPQKPAITAGNVASLSPSVVRANTPEVLEKPTQSENVEPYGHFTEEMLTPKAASKPEVTLEDLAREDKVEPRRLFSASETPEKSTEKPSVAGEKNASVATEKKDSDETVFSSPSVQKNCPLPIRKPDEVHTPKANPFFPVKPPTVTLNSAEEGRKLIGVLCSEKSHLIRVLDEHWKRLSTTLLELKWEILTTDASGKTHMASEPAARLFVEAYHSVYFLKRTVFEGVVKDLEASGCDLSLSAIKKDHGDWVRLGRWKSRSQNWVTFLRNSMNKSNQEDCHIYGASILRDTGVDIGVLADILKEDDISRLRRVIRKLWMEKGVKYTFRHPKPVINKTGRDLSTEEQDTVNSSLGHITLEGFFEVLAYYHSQEERG